MLLYLNLNASSIILHKKSKSTFISHDYDAPSRDYKPSTSKRVKQHDDIQPRDVDTKDTIIEETAVNTAEKVVDTTTTTPKDNDDQKITNHYGQSKYSKNDLYKMIQDSKDGIVKKGKIAWLMRYVVFFYCLCFVLDVILFRKFFRKPSSREGVK